MVRIIGWVLLVIAALVMVYIMIKKGYEAVIEKGAAAKQAVLDGTETRPYADNLKDRIEGWQAEEKVKKMGLDAIKGLFAKKA